MAFFTSHAQAIAWITQYKEYEDFSVETVKYINSDYYLLWSLEYFKYKNNEHKPCYVVTLHTLIGSDKHHSWIVQHTHLGGRYLNCKPSDLELAMKTNSSFRTETYDRLSKQYPR